MYQEHYYLPVVCHRILRTRGGVGFSQRVPPELQGYSVPCTCVSDTSTIRQFTMENYLCHPWRCDLSNKTKIFTMVCQRVPSMQNSVKGSEYSGDPVAAYVGDTVTYTFDIYNSGTTTLSQLELTNTKVSCWIYLSARIHINRGTSLFVSPKYLFAAVKVLKTFAFSG